MTACVEKSKETANHEIKGCGKIISTAPSITETLFELGLGENIIGVTENCHFPKEVKNIPKIGKVLDINIEFIVSLKPDTVFVISANDSLKKKLEALNIKTVVVDQSTIGGFMTSLDIIGKQCLISERSAELKKNILSRMTTKSIESLKKILIVVGRDYSSTQIKDVYAAGSDGFYSEILKSVKIRNAYEGDLNYPKIQIEGIMSLNPDIIVDVVTTGEICEKDKERLKQSWLMLVDINAVKKGKVFIVCNDYWSIPGPRFVSIIEELSEMVNSE